MRNAGPTRTRLSGERGQVMSLRLAYKIHMEPLTVIAIFLLGASVGSLITTIRYRSELAHLEAQIKQIQQQTKTQNREAA